MRWSFSAHTSFRRCPRQWFYRAVFSNSRARDPGRREAYRLSKLESIQAWRGKIVDTVISDMVIPSLARGRPITVEQAEQAALNLFDNQRIERMSGNGNGLAGTSAGGTFYEMEYGLSLTDEMFAVALSEVRQAIESFYKAEPVWNVLRRARGLFPQRTLTFKHDDVSVQVRPDLILFRSAAGPVIYDWKVNARPLRDYWLQLVTGAIAITRCEPHRDWPIGAVQHGPYEVELLEIQLLTGDVRLHMISPSDVEDAEDLISISANQMQLARGDNDIKTLKPEDFSVTSDPWACQVCPFRKLCWGSML